MITKEDKLKLFINEINDIKDLQLRAFATELIANADDYFFSVPASSSGKYHPPFDLGDGGLVRHTRCVVYMAQCVAESMIFSDYDKDLLTISALVHDIKKQGSGVGKHTVWEHPILAKEYVLETYKKDNFGISEESIMKICGAVLSHMGKWGNFNEYARDNEPLPLPSNEFEKALQIADYISSRREITEFNFRPTEEVNIIKEEAKPVSEMSLIEFENYVLPFGKHRGKTLKEIKPTGYLEWMLKQEDFSNKEAQEVVKYYFKKLRESVSSDTRDAVKSENMAYISKPSNVDIDNLPF